MQGYVDERIKQAQHKIAIGKCGRHEPNRRRTPDVSSLWPASPAPLPAPAMRRLKHGSAYPCRFSNDESGARGQVRAQVTQVPWGAFSPPSLSSVLRPVNTKRSRFSATERHPSRNRPVLAAPGELSLIQWINVAR